MGGNVKALEFERAMQAERKSFHFYFIFLNFLQREKRETNGRNFVLGV